MRPNSGQDFIYVVGKVRNRAMSALPAMLGKVRNYCPTRTLPALLGNVSIARAMPALPKPLGKVGHC